MTLPELQKVEAKLLSRMTTASLNKKEEAEINVQLQKIGRFKLTAPKDERRQQKDDENSDDVARAKSELEKLIGIQQRVKDQLAEVEMKVDAIDEDLHDLRDEKKELQ